MAPSAEGIVPRFSSLITRLSPGPAFCEEWRGEGSPCTPSVPDANAINAGGDRSCVQ